MSNDKPTGSSFDMVQNMVDTIRTQNTNNGSALPSIMNEVKNNQLTDPAGSIDINMSNVRGSMGEKLQDKVEFGGMVPRFVETAVPINGGSRNKILSQTGGQPVAAKKSVCGQSTTALAPSEPQTSTKRPTTSTSPSSPRSSTICAET